MSPQLYIDITYSSRQEFTVPATLDTIDVMEWAKLEDEDQITPKILKDYVIANDPESLIGWGYQDDLQIHEVNL